MGSFWFPPLWIKPKIFNTHVLVLHFCPYASSFSLFTSLMTLQEYLCAKLDWIMMLCLPTSWSTFLAHCLSLLYLLGVYVHHIFLMLPQCMLLCPWEGKFFLQLFFFTTIFAINFLTIIFVVFPTTMTFHRCFREEHFSGRKITPRERHRVDFGTPKISRISE